MHTSKTILPGVMLLLAAILALGGCAGPTQTVVSASVVEAMSGPAADTGDYAHATEPIEFVFPRDHGPHPDFRTEWWYYTGNLQDANGNDYGYQLTFFRSALAPEMAERASTLATNQVYMAHFALTDAVRGAHESFERYSRGAGGLAGAQGEPTFGVWLEDWSAVEVAPEVMRLRASVAGQEGETAIDLTLRQTRPPVLQGDRGLDQKGPEPGNASYYYSLTSLDTSGVITSADHAIAISGVSWMDHEFSTSALSAGAEGWDWFSLQLDNGVTLMLYVMRRMNGEALQATGTLAFPDHSQVALTGDDYAVEATGEWTSPETGIRYPSGWRIALPGQGATLVITPLLPDQEMAVNFFYWEGAVDLTGSWRGEPVTGKGYVELTGYGSRNAAYQR